MISETSIQKINSLLQSGVSSDFYLAVSMGQVDGFSIIDKFGINPLITTGTDPEDIWEGGGLYTFDPDNTAPIISLASNSALDTQIINVQGLDIDGNSVSQNITLNGTNRVALDTALWRVFRMENEGTSDLNGTVFCYTGTGLVPSVGDPEVRAIIDNGNNQTLMAIYTVPADKYAFLLRGEVGLKYSATIGAGSNFATICYKSRRFGKVFKIKKELSLLTGGTSLYVDKRSAPDIIPPKTDIVLCCKEVSEDLGMWGTFDLLLVDKTLIESNS